MINNLIKKFNQKNKKHYKHNLNNKIFSNRMKKSKIRIKYNHYRKKFRNRMILNNWMTLNNWI